MSIPKIEWDDQNSNGFGGFKVVENLENFIAPADWKIDPDDPTHFLPKYKPCRYRRLSQGTHKGRPWCKIHCLLFEEVVDAQTCVDCTDLQPPQKFVPTSPDSETSDTEKQKISVDDIVFTSDTIQINPLDDDTVFSAEQPESKYIKKTNKGHKKPRTPWKPCIYRRERISEDCDCPKLICSCETCPLFNNILSKKDCKECQHRREN